MMCAGLGTALARVTVDHDVVVVHPRVHHADALAPFAARHPERLVPVGGGLAHAIAVAGGLGDAGLAALVLLDESSGQIVRLLAPLVDGVDRNVTVCITAADAQLADFALLPTAPDVRAHLASEPAQVVTTLHAALASRTLDIVHAPLTLRPLRAIGGRWHTGAGWRRLEALAPAADALIVAGGIGVHAAVHAANDLYRDGLCADVIDVTTLSPLPSAALVDAAQRAAAVVVVENGPLPVLRPLVHDALADIGRTHDVVLSLPVAAGGRAIADRVRILAGAVAPTP